VYTYLNNQSYKLNLFNIVKYRNFDVVRSETHAIFIPSCLNKPRRDTTFGRNNAEVNYFNPLRTNGKYVYHLL
jgi:hypothetical protein